MPNLAAAGGRPAENGATPGSESLYLSRGAVACDAAASADSCSARPLRVSSRRRRLGRILRPLLRAQKRLQRRPVCPVPLTVRGSDAAGERWRSENAK